MQALISKYQLGHILTFIKKDYLVYGTRRDEGKNIFGLTVNADEVIIPTPKTVMSFKKILFDNERRISEDKRKIAFFGIASCDALAVEIFKKEFANKNLLAKDVLVISSECQPDDFCFCHAFGLDKPANFDLHIQEAMPTGRQKKSGYRVFAGSTRGAKILDEVGIKTTPIGKELKEIPNSAETIDKNELSQAISDRKNNTDFWQGTANNCFGCGACTAVCPLCFCTRQDFDNKTDGSCNQCLSWDACFSKSFFEIQNHFNFRPEPVDRLYNWYHHKFVRSFEDKRHFLCTGCGRCIEACPAHLNQHRIISSIVSVEEEK